MNLGVPRAKGAGRSPFGLGRQLAPARPTVHLTLRISQRHMSSPEFIIIKIIDNKFYIGNVVLLFLESMWSWK